MVSLEPNEPFVRNGYNVFPACCLNDYSEWNKNHWTTTMLINKKREKEKNFLNSDLP